MKIDCKKEGKLFIDKLIFSYYMNPLKPLLPELWAPIIQGAQVQLQGLQAPGPQGHKQAQ